MSFNFLFIHSSLLKHSSLNFGSRSFQGHVHFLFAHLYLSIRHWILDQGYFKLMSFNFLFFTHLYLSIPHWILDQGHFKVMSFFICSSLIKHSPLSFGSRIFQGYVLFLFAHLYLSIPNWILDQGYFKVMSFNFLFIRSSLLKHSSLNFGSRTFQGRVLFYLLFST